MIGSVAANCLVSSYQPSAFDNLNLQPPFSSMYSAQPGFPRPFRQKQIPSTTGFIIKKSNIEIAIAGWAFTLLA